MAQLTIREVNQTPDLTVTYAAAGASGDNFINDDRTLVRFKNAHASATRTVTITAQKTSVYVSGYGTLTVGNISVVVPAVGEAVVAAPMSAYNDASGKAYMTYSSNADLTIRVEHLAAL